MDLSSYVGGAGGLGGGGGGDSSEAIASSGVNFGGPGQAPGSSPNNDLLVIVAVLVVAVLGFIVLNKS